MPVVSIAHSASSTHSRWSLALVIAGVICLALAASFSVERAWGALLTAALLLTSVGLGAAFFLGFHSVTGARWSRPLIPAARRLAGTLPATGLFAGLVALTGLLFYPWTHSDFPHEDTYWFQDAWLSPGFFFMRTTAYVVIWGAVGHWMSRRYAPEHVGRSACCIVALAATVCLSAFDWVMSLEPLWFSTMFGVYQFSGIFICFLASLVIFIAWSHRGSRQVIDTRVLHDLGKLLFGFSCFWMYIWFSQYMLIWYVNISEESVYFIRRTQDFWWPILLLSLLLNWGIPFVALLSRPSKQNWRVMFLVSLLILLGRWVDLCVAVAPAFTSRTQLYALPELGSLLLSAGLIAWFLLRPSAPRTAIRYGVQVDAAA